MYTPTTKFFILVAFVVATCTATTTDTKIAEVKVAMAPAELAISGATSATNDNWVGGETSLTITTKVAVAAAETSITIETKVKATTKECNLTATSPSASITITLELPDAFVSALSTLDGVISGLPSAADLVKPFTFEYAGDADGVSVLVSDVAVGALKQNLQMTGSDIMIEIKKEDLVVKQAGLAVPMTAYVTLMDPTKITIPISDACHDGESTPCDASRTKGSGRGLACYAFCQAIKAVIGTKPAFSMKIDLAAQLTADATTIPVGDVSAVCAAPVSEDENLSAGSTSTVSFGAVATVVVMLLSAFH